MLSEHLPLLLFSFKVARTSGCLDFDWLPGSHPSFLSDSDPKTRLRMKRKLKIHTLLVLILLLQIACYFKTFEEEKVPVLTMFAAATMTISMNLSNVFARVCFKESSDIVLYVNGLLRFVTGYPIGLKRTWAGRPLIGKLNILLAYGMAVNLILFPFAYVFGLLWHLPCQPALVGYWLIPECWSSRGQEPSIVMRSYGNSVKLVVCLFNYLANAFSFNATSFGIVGVSILCTMTLQDFILQFWSLWNGTELTLPKLALMYRKIQLLAKLSNSIQKRSMTLVMVMASIVGQPMAFMILVRLQIDWRLGILGFQILADSFLVLSVFLGGMAGIYGESWKVRWNMKRSLLAGSGAGAPGPGPGPSTGGNRTYGRDFKWKRVFIKSCLLIKIQFAELYFVEELTPLNCMDFANDLTVQTLLLAK